MIFREHGIQLRPYLPGPVAQPRASSGRDFRTPRTETRAVLAELPSAIQRVAAPPSHAEAARAVHLGTRQGERVPRHGAPTAQRSGVRLAQGRFISSQRSRPRTLRHCHGNDDRIGGVGAHGHLGVRSQSASAGRRPAQRDRAAEASSHQGSSKSRRQSGCCRCAHTTPIVHMPCTRRCPR